MSNIEKAEVSETPATIPFYAHEGEVTRLERINKRLWIAMLVVFAAFVLSNLAWIIYENQFEDVAYTYEVRQDSGEGGNNQYTDNRVVIGGDDYGQTDGQDQGYAQDGQNQ